MKLYLIRHGESEANLLQMFSNRGFKHGLTELGREQTEALSKRLELLPLARIYSSPLRRAVETAQILAYRLDLPYETTDALREYDCGVLEGRADPESWAEHDRVYYDWARHGLWESRVEGGESLLDIRARFLPFLEQLLEESAESSQGLLLVGHGGLYRSVLPLVLDNVGFDFAASQPVWNADYVLAEPRDGKLLCVEWCGLAPPFGSAGAGPQLA